MAYFFGFFGISFLDTNAMERSPSSFGLSHLDDQLYTSRSTQRQPAGFAESTTGGKGGAYQYVVCTLGRLRLVHIVIRPV